MFFRTMSAGVLILLLSAASTFTEPTRPPVDKDDLSQQIRSAHDKMMRAQIEGMERRLAIEKLFAQAAPTNWTEYDIIYYDIHWAPDYAARGIGGSVGVYGTSSVASLDSVMLDGLTLPAAIATLPTREIPVHNTDVHAQSRRKPLYDGNQGRPVRFSRRQKPKHQPSPFKASKQAVLMMHTSGSRPDQSRSDSAP